MTELGGERLDADERGSTRGRRSPRDAIGIVGVAARRRSPASSRCRPFTARTIVWPVFLGMLAVACGIWALPRGERRLGLGGDRRGRCSGSGSASSRSSRASDNLEQSSSGPT